MDLWPKPNTSKILEENEGPKLHDIVYGNDFLDKNTKDTCNKRKKIGTFDFIKLKTNKQKPLHQRPY